MKNIFTVPVEDVKINSENYVAIPVLKLTTGKIFELKSLNKSQTEILNLLKKEAAINKFKILINENFIS